MPITSGTITNNEVWTIGDSPITLTGDLTIGDGRGNGSLTISAGVEVYFRNGYNSHSITVEDESYLKALGEDDKPIKITSNAEETNYGKYLYGLSGSIIKLQYTNINHLSEGLKSEGSLSLLYCTLCDTSSYYSNLDFQGTYLDMRHTLLVHNGINYNLKCDTNAAETLIRLYNNTCIGSMKGCYVKFNGDDSHLEFYNNLITDASIGLELKDNSSSGNCKFEYNHNAYYDNTSNFNNTLPANKDFCSENGNEQNPNYFASSDGYYYLQNTKLLYNGLNHHQIGAFGAIYKFDLAGTMTPDEFSIVNFLPFYRLEYNKINEPLTLVIYNDEAGSGTGVKVQIRLEIRCANGYYENQLNKLGQEAINEHWLEARLDDGIWTAIGGNSHTGEPYLDLDYIPEDEYKIIHLRISVPSNPATDEQLVYLEAAFFWLGSTGIYGSGIYAYSEYN